MSKKKIIKIVHICCGCSRIMDNTLERHTNPDGDFDIMYSHSICPACAARLYPDIELYPDENA